MVDEIEKYITNETDSQKLMTYIYEKDPDVIAALAANEYCTAEMNEMLRVNGDEVTRALLAGKKSADGVLLGKLASDESVLVRLTVAENPNTPVEVLERLSEDSDKEVRRAALGVRGVEKENIEENYRARLKVNAGNVLDNVQAGEKTAIVVFCNDVGGYGKGFARDVGEKYPRAKEMYKKWFRSQRDFELGGCQFVKVDEGVYVIHLLVEHGFQTKTNPEPMDYDALRYAMKKLANTDWLSDAKVLVPRIGSYKAGGEWAKIDGIIQDELKGHDVAVFDKNLKRYRNRVDFDMINSIPLCELAEHLGYTLVRSGRHMSLSDHDSVKIYLKRNYFYRFSTIDHERLEKGKRSIVVQGGPIDFMMHFGNNEEGMSKGEAIKELQRYLGVNPEATVERYKDYFKSLPDEPVAGDIELPKADLHNKNIYAYLLEKRMLNKSIVDYFVEHDLLYQDEKKNCVWVTRDEEGNPNFASLRSTGSKKFAIDLLGCDYNECFFIKGRENDTMIVTEAIIDMMSVMSKIDNGKKDFRDVNWLSLNGTNKIMAVFKQLEKHPEIKNLFIAFDNDTKGREAVEAVKGHLESIGWDGKCVRWIPPIGKDWNQEYQYEQTMRRIKRNVMEDTQKAIEESFQEIHDYDSMKRYVEEVYMDDMPQGIHEELDFLKGIEEETQERRIEEYKKEHCERNSSDLNEKMKKAKVLQQDKNKENVHEKEKAKETIEI